MKTSVVRTRIALVLVLLLGTSAGATTKGPDAGGYSATDDVVSSFIDLASGGGTSMLSGVDDGMAPLTLPFAVPFYGVNYSTACVSTNGAIYLISSPLECSAFVDFANTDLNATPPASLAAVLPFWTDLSFEVPGSGAVFYGIVAGQGARRFVVQWQNAFPAGSTTPVTFQAIFTEGSDSIQYQYKQVDLGAGNPATRGSQATVGIRNSGGAPSLEWSFNVPVLDDGSAIRFSAAVADTTAPVLTLPASVSTEATGPQTPVTFTAAAIDDVDGAVTPVCDPISGTLFPVGTTVVECTATDAAGNAAEGTLNVVVTDATPPALTLPAPIVVTATSASGAAVTFAATASDLVSGSRPVACTPASGTTFAVGTHTVACVASDSAGNTATGSFTIKVDPTATTPGLMTGHGHITASATRHDFEFLVRERSSGADAGLLRYENRTKRRGRRDEENEFRSKQITSVQFSDQPGVSPGRPRTRVDTVTFKGTGEWNGKSGYTFEATAVDSGEPGRDRDRFTIVIRKGGQVVASVSGEIDGGNIQSWRTFLWWW